MQQSVMELQINSPDIEKQEFLQWSIVHTANSVCSTILNA